MKEIRMYKVVDVLNGSRLLKKSYASVESAEVACQRARRIFFRRLGNHDSACYFCVVPETWRYVFDPSSDQFEWMDTDDLLEEVEK